MFIFYYPRYSISVLLGHTEPNFPYISDTGTYSPESCIFGQFVNIGAFLGKYVCFLYLNICLLIKRFIQEFFFAYADDCCLYLLYLHKVTIASTVLILQMYSEEDSQSYDDYYTSIYCSILHL